MIPSGSSNSIGGAQSVNPSLLRSNSSLLGGSQPGSVPSQPPFSSLVSPRTQFNSNSLLGNISNVPPLSNSFGNGGPVGGLSSPPANLQQHGGFGAVDTVFSAGNYPLSFTASATQSQGQQQCFQNPSNSQVLADQPQLQIDAVLNFQQQFSLSPSQQQQQQLLRGGLSNLNHMAPVKLEPQMGSIKLEPQMGPNNHIGPSQQLQTFRGISTVKMEPQQLQTLRSLGPVKMENQHSDPSMFLQQQQLQQQQHIFQLSRQNSHAAAAQLSFLQQQRIFQLQQQQQQQHIAKTLPQQRSQLHQQLLQQNLPIRTTMKSTMYEPGMCARRLTQYMYHQQHRPQDNNIEFWRKFVAEYFSPDAKKRWCVSLYGTGHQTTGVFPQDVWHCEICTHKPGRGFETTVEVLPRLFQIKYASGTLEELLYVDMPREYQNASGQIVLDYSKAIQESVFEQLRVVRDGHLRILFNPDLKISSWEFCAKRHEELVPRRVIIPQISQLGAVVQRYQVATQNAPSGVPIQDLQNTCNSFVASARQLAKALEVPLVNDLGYTKRYVRCLQISEVVNSMKDLIDHSKETGAGPMESLINFPGRQQQIIDQNANHNNPSSMHATAATIVGTPQNSTNTEQEKQMISLSNPYAGNNVQIPSASSSNSVHPLKPSGSNNPVSISQNATHLSTTASLAMLQENDANDSQSSVQQILQELMMSSQLNDTNLMETDTKPTDGIHPTLSAMAPSLNAGTGFTGLYGTGTSASASGMRAAMITNGMVMNGRHGTISLPHDPTAINRQSQDLNNQLLDRLEAVNKFDNLQFDWKSSP